MKNKNSQIYYINGGKKLSGNIKTNGAKNSAVFLLCASLLNKNTSIFYNMPRIEEVYRLIEVLNSIGVKTSWIENNTLKITPPKKINLDNLNGKSAQLTRSIILFMGPLIHQFSNFSLPTSGGCKLGKRTVLPHLMALKQFGVNIKTHNNEYKINTPNKFIDVKKLVMYESGDTATGNAIMAASKLPFTTTIKFASANYQIQDLCFYLQKLGVKFEGIGTSTLTIKGASKIDKPVEYYISEDPIESMLFIAIAATTNSSITIQRCPIDFLDLELSKLETMGFKYKILKQYKSKNKLTNLVDIQTYPSKLKALEEKLHPLPSTGINIDNLPFFVPIATQAKGRTLIHDWVYENRAIYYIELIRLGAQMILADPHRVFIDGPTELKGAEIIAPPALRPSAIVLVAMLAAKGKSILRNTYGIERGYENLVDRLSQLGADIKREI